MPKSGDIAKNNNATPSEIYELLSSNLNKQIRPSEIETPQNIGMQTIKSISKSTDKDLSTLLLILKEQGIVADENTKLRTIAEHLGMSPRDVYNMLTEK